MLNPRYLDSAVEALTFISLAANLDWPALAERLERLEAVADEAKTVYVNACRDGGIDLDRLADRLEELEELAPKEGQTKALDARGEGRG